MRFAMRLSIVMTITCGLSFLLTYTRSYWIPLNAFILLQPSYEDSSYWDIIRQGTRAETSLSISNEILTYFHMLYQECAGYLTKETGLPYRESLRMVLLNLWHMFSELEQIHFLVRTKSIRPEEQKPFLHLIDAIQEELYPIISAENFPVIRREIRYQEPEVTYVLNQYLDHAEKLLSYSYCIPF